MRVLTVTGVWMILLLTPTGVAAQGANAEAVVSVGVFGYRDGSYASAAYDTEPSLDSRVYASGTLCQLGAGYRQAPAWAMHGWRFSGRLASKTPDEVVVHLKWQRTLDFGNEVPLPENDVQLRLRAGDRVTLDRVSGPADSPCSMNVSFEVRYIPRFSDAMRPDGTGSVGSLARGTDGIGVGGPTVRGGVGGFSAAQVGDRGSWMNVDLWLVHTAPDRNEEVIHQFVHAPQEGADFAFAPISLATPRGPVVVQISGSFGVSNGQLTFVTNRNIKYGNRARQGAASETQGGGKAVTPMPAPNEVLSFELPPIPSPGSAALPNQLAVRVRIAR